MTNNNRNLVQDLQKQLINKVLSFMNEKDLNMVELNTPFRIFVEEPSFDDDYVMVPLASRYLYRDGSIGADGEEVKIENLSIYEIAYIMDVLESGDYTVDDDDEFIDPAGGRGLHSHI